MNFYPALLNSLMGVMWASGQSLAPPFSTSFSLLGCAQFSQRVFSS